MWCLCCYNLILKDMKKFSEWVIHSKSFFWTALAIMLVFSLLSILLYIFDVYSIYNTLFSELSTSGKVIDVWSRIILTSVGSTLAVLSLLLVNRHNKNFFYYGVTGTILLTINAFMSELMFDAIKWLCVCIVLSSQAIIWNLRGDREVVFKKITTGPLVTTIVTILLLSLVASIGVAMIPKESLFYNKKPYMDPVQFTFTITGNLLAIFYFVESRIYYMIGNTITLVMFIIIVSDGELLSLIQLSQSLLYLLITICGYFTMLNNRNDDGKKWVVDIQDSICIGPHCNLQ